MLARILLSNENSDPKIFGSEKSRIESQKHFNSGKGIGGRRNEMATKFPKSLAALKADETDSKWRIGARTDRVALGQAPLIMRCIFPKPVRPIQVRKMQEVPLAVGKIA